MTAQLYCPHCGSTRGACPECRTLYPHGTASQCTKPKCVEVNAPIDCCGCSRTATAKGIVDHQGKLKRYDKQRKRRYEG